MNAFSPYILRRHCRAALMAAATLLSVGNAPAAEPAEEESRATLTEVIVTAEKREENLQTVPLSVAVISAQEIQRAGIFGTLDYANRLPNVSFNEKAGDSGRGNSEDLVLRGVSGLNTTARYIDDAAVPPGIDLKAVDVTRIEVLRGPQGTLYGASSMGGAVKIATNAPDLSGTSGDIAATGSSVSEGTGNYRVDGILNAPLNPGTAGVRLVGYYDNESGVFDRYVGTSAPYVVEKDIDGERNSGVQLKGKWIIDDSLQITPRLVYQKTVADGAHYADISPDNFTQYRLLGLPEPYNDRIEQATVNIDYDAHAFSLISATSYTKWDVFEQEDATEFVYDAFALTTPLPSPITRTETHRIFQQELRLVSKVSGPFAYQAGLYYVHDTQDRDYYLLTPGLGPAIGVDTDLGYSETTTLRNREYAAFGELTYSITDALKGVLGGRWFNSRVDVTRLQDGIFNGGPTSTPGSQQDTGVDPKASLQYQITPNAMAYATAAKGYRIGGVNYLVPESLCAADLAALGLSTAPKSFASDKLWSYELGAKTSWLDQRLVLNGAAFWIDWKNIQQTIHLACGYPFTANVGAARNRGGELELTALPLDSLQLSLGLGFTDAVITDPGQGTGAVAGDRVQQVPRLTANASGQYTWQLGGGVQAFFRADFQHQSRSFTTFDQTDPARIRAAFSVFNARIGAERGPWRGALFADNITNEHINYSDVTSLAAEVPGRPRYATNRPRTIGIQVGYSFGR